MAKIEEQLKKIADHSGDTIEKTKERFDATKARIAPEANCTSETELENRAIDAMIGTDHRKNTTEIKIFDGMFLACTGRINDWAKREYDAVQAIVSNKTHEEAYKEGLVDSTGALLYPATKRFNAGKVIDPEEIYFEVWGTVLENKKPVNMCFWITKLQLLREVCLNTPVRFSASINRGRSNGYTMYLMSEPKTNFEYTIVNPLAPDIAMDWAAQRFQNLPVDQLPTMCTLALDKNGNEYSKVDNRYWMLKDVVVSYIHKNRVGGRATCEFSHPDLLEWNIVTISENIKNAYDLVLDNRANICGRLKLIDVENKTIVFDCAGYWQAAKYRAKNPAGDPSNTSIKFVD